MAIEWIVVLSIGFIYYLFFGLVWFAGKKDKKKDSENIAFSQLNDKFVNKSKNSKSEIEEDLTFNASIFDQVESDFENNDLLDHLKANSGEENLNSQNDEKPKNSGFRVIKNSEKKE